MSPVRYFSSIRDATGSAQVAPNPAFSTYAATAIFGLSLGAKQMNTELSSPWGFCAVPVLPQTSSPGTAAAKAVPPAEPPPLTALYMPSTAVAKYEVSTRV